jgi:hypothetical protein
MSDAFFVKNRHLEPRVAFAGSGKHKIVSVLMLRKFFEYSRLQFEREEGTLDQFEDAEIKIEARMKKVFVDREK